MQGGMARLLLVVALLHFCFGDSIAPDEDITCINFQEDWNNVVTEDGQSCACEMCTPDLVDEDFRRSAFRNASSRALLSS